MKNQADVNLQALQKHLEAITSEGDIQKSLMQITRICREATELDLTQLTLTSLIATALIHLLLSHSKIFAIKLRSPEPLTDDLSEKIDIITQISSRNRLGRVAVPHVMSELAADADVEIVKACILKYQSLTCYQNGSLLPAKITQFLVVQTSSPNSSQSSTVHHKLPENAEIQPTFFDLQRGSRLHCLGGLAISYVLQTVVTYRDGSESTCSHNTSIQLMGYPRYTREEINAQFPQNVRVFAGEGEVLVCGQQISQKKPEATSSPQSIAEKIQQSGGSPTMPRAERETPAETDRKALGQYY